MRLLRFSLFFSGVIGMLQAISLFVGIFVSFASGQGVSSIILGFALIFLSALFFLVYFTILRSAIKGKGVSCCNANEQREEVESDFSEDEMGVEIKKTTKNKTRR